VSLPVNAETKIGALLEAYPEIEQLLIDSAPAFEKLRNPILRKTVAKVATVEQAARIGGLRPPELVQKIREAIGQTTPAAGESAPTEPRGAQWLESCPVVEEIDADELLDRGIHPGGKVRQRLSELHGSEVIRVKSSFRPEPLIQTSRENGYEVHSVALSSHEHITYFGRKGG
jgi:hypothetical protein